MHAHIHSISLWAFQFTMCNIKLYYMIRCCGKPGHLRQHAAATSKKRSARGPKMLKRLAFHLYMCGGLMGLGCFRFKVYFPCKSYIIYMFFDESLSVCSGRFYFYWPSFTQKLYMVCACWKKREIVQEMVHI